MSEWRTVRLGDILSRIIGGGTPSKSQAEYWNGNIPWASVKDIQDGQHRLYETQDKITELGLINSATNLIPAETVVTSTRMGLGRTFVTKIDIAINQDLKALFPTQDLNNEFLLWLMLYLAP